MLTDLELERYARHIVLNGVGGPGQGRLKAAKVLVIGAGGLGAPVIHYLAAAGVGLIGLVDDDSVSLSNLQRQVIHRTEDIGRPKVESAAEAVARINPHVDIACHAERLVAANAEALLAGYDIVVDGSDNFDTRYLASDTACRLRKPLVTAAVSEFDGSITTLMPWLADAEGRPNPTYRCLFPDPPPAGTVPTCALTGVMGALTGVIGTLQALEVVKLITGVGEPLIGRLLLFDGRGMRFDTIRYRWNPGNPLTGRVHAGGL